MQFLGRTRIHHIKPVIMILALACIIYIIILTMFWTSSTKTCVDVFSRPYEPYRMRIKPIKKNEFPLSELQKNDYENLINLRDFKFIINDKNHCNVPDVSLLVLVPSASRNKNNRNIIRETWGHTDRNIVIVFTLGYTDDYELQKEIKEENALYKDIVQGNIWDTYKNLTYKTVMTLKYAIYHCPQATYILKIDDDSFVNLPLLRNFLRNDISPFGAEELFLCNDMTGSPVIRNNDSKWYVSPEEFSDDIYPSYCSGWYTIFSPDVVFKLYRESQKQQKYFYIEDVFVYGLAAKGVPELTHIDIHYYTLAFRDYRLLFNGTYDNLNILLGQPNLSPSLQRQFWDYFRTRPVPVSVYKKAGQL